MGVIFISIGRMLFLASILDHADPLFALVITPGAYLQHIEVVDLDTASGILKADIIVAVMFTYCILVI